MSQKEPELLPIKMKEKALPGRLATKLISDYEGPHGYLCTGCKQILVHPFYECDCSDWTNFYELHLLDVTRVREAHPDDNGIIEKVETFVARKVEINDDMDS